jgi:single-strand DNA-binding protein
MSAIGSLVGRVVADPVLAEIESDGSQYTKASFSIACQANYSRDVVNFVDVVCWGEQATNAAKWLTKGRPVSVVASIRQERWVADDGSNRSRIVFQADAIEYLPDGRRTQTETPPVDVQVEGAPPRAARPMPSRLGSEQQSPAQVEGQQELVVA